MIDDMATYSKCPRQRMRTTWTLLLRFCEEMHIAKKEEKRSDRVGTYRGTRAAR